MFKKASPLPDNMDVARRRMVDEQLKSRGITDEGVLSAMLKVPRQSCGSCPGFSWILSWKKLEFRFVFFMIPSSN